MIPIKTIKEIIAKHSSLEKDLSSSDIEKNCLQKNLKNIQM